MKMYLFRLSQTIKYGWKDAQIVSQKHNIPRIKAYFDIILCFYRYRLRSRQYVKNDFWSLKKDEQKRIGMELKLKNIQVDKWNADCYENRKFLEKWKDYKWHTSGTRYHKRLMAYTNRYNMGANCIVHYDVVLERNHGLDGTIKIGNNVLLGKNLHIDYSGDLTIHDDVKISGGVVIETHSHSAFTSVNSGIAKKEHLEIFEHVNIGTGAIITESCHKIGRYAKIGAGSVVRNNVPPYAIVIGNPARIINFIFTPTEMENFENGRYSEENKTQLSSYERFYNQYYVERLKDISLFLKIRV